ncbi:hypothetical protein AB0L40_15940 [Patulibacter sp. NPDC049589]|uniref:hypothetical protein n=1 Tax=Patulibacter sp. NPDC049589 TaxID=3154731 RepID=UPI00343077F9
MQQSPGLARALPRSRAAIATTVALVLTVAAGLWATVAFAIPPGGPVELHPSGWTAKLDRRVVPSGDATYGGVTNPGKVTFTVDGAPAGTEINAKIDDGLVKPAVAQAQDIVKTVTVPVGGGPVSGTIDLATDVLPSEVAKLRSGRHNIRLVGSGYSFRLDFAVRSDLAPGGPASGSAGRTAVVGPATDQPLGWANLSEPYGFIPQLQVGSLIPYRATGFDPGQTVVLKVDDNAFPTPDPNPPVPSDLTIWALLTADSNGVVSGVLDLPSVTAADRQGTHWLRFLTGLYGGTSGSQFAPFAVKAATNTRVLNVATAAQRGREVALSGTGFKREPDDYTPFPAAGQTLTARLDGTGPAVDIRADGDGNLSGTLPVPADAALGEHTIVFFQGFRKESDYPEAVYRRSVTVTEFVPDKVIIQPPTVPTETTPIVVPKPVPARPAKVSSKSLKATKKGRVSLSLLRPSVAGKAAVSVTSKKKIRLKGAKKAKILTLVKSATFSLKAGTAKQTSVLSLKLTKEARSYLKRVKSVKVVVKVAPKGGKAFTKTLTLKG